MLVERRRPLMHQHRRLLVEQLEDRRLLSAGSAEFCDDFSNGTLDGWTSIENHNGNGIVEAGGQLRADSGDGRSVAARKVEHLVAFVRILFVGIFEGSGGQFAFASVHDDVVVLRSVVLDDSQFGQSPTDAVLGISVGGDVVLPVVSGAFVPHFEEFFFFVVNDAPLGNDQFLATNRLSGFQFQNRVVFIFCWLVQDRKYTVGVRDNVLINEQLFLGANRDWCGANNGDRTRQANRREQSNCDYRRGQ